MRERNAQPVSGSQFGEEGKVALRNIRRDILKQLEKDAKSKDSPISEVRAGAACRATTRAGDGRDAVSGHPSVRLQDEKKAIEKEVQGVTDEMVKKIDELVSQKQKELAKV